MSETNAIMSEVLAALRRARKQQGMSQADVAVILGLSDSASSYAVIESGRSPLSVERFLRLCRLFNLNPIEVLGLTRSALLEDMIQKTLNLTVGLRALSEQAQQSIRVFEEFTGTLEEIWEEGEKDE